MMNTKMKMPDHIIVVEAQVFLERGLLVPAPGFGVITNGPRVVVLPQQNKGVHNVNQQNRRQAQFDQDDNRLGGHGTWRRR